MEEILVEMEVVKAADPTRLQDCDGAALGVCIDSRLTWDTNPALGLLKHAR